MDIHPGDELELIDSFNEFRAGTHCICTEYTESALDWKQAAVKTDIIPNHFCSDWIVAKRFKVIKPAAQNGWNTP